MRPTIYSMICRRLYKVSSIYRGRTAGVTSFSFVQRRQMVSSSDRAAGPDRPGDGASRGREGQHKPQTLTLDEYDVYGFDVDNTLAEYNIPRLFDLVHNSFATYLVEKKGCHKDLLEPFNKYKDFCTRGLVLDIKHGNFLKVAEDGTIFRASHGMRFMTDTEICKRYKGRHWSRSDELIKKVDNIGNKEVMIFDNFFDMIGTVMIARMVDIADREAGGPQEDYTHLWEMIMEAYGDAYHYQAFSVQTGGFFPGVVKDTEKFIKPCSEEVKGWLKRLHQDGKVIFFMTSSHIDFATHSLQFIFGSDWQNYFDIGITRARKPGFFFNNRPFLRLAGMSEKEPIQKLEKGKIYSQGNKEEFEKFLVDITGKQQPKILFFGDSVRSDIYPSRCHADWDTCAVIHEMEAEISPTQFAADQSADIAAKKRKLEGPDGETRTYLSSSGWGSFFTDTLPTKVVEDKAPSDTQSTAEPGEDDSPAGGSTPPSTKTQLNTLWGHIINKYACIAVPSLHHVVGLPQDSALKAFDKVDCDQWGFHPRAPAALRPPELK